MARPRNARYAAARDAALAGRGDPQTAGTLPAAVAARMAKVADQVAPRNDPAADSRPCECTGDDTLPHTGHNHLRIGQGRGKPALEVCSIQTGDMRCPCAGYRPRVNGPAHE